MAGEIVCFGSLKEVVWAERSLKQYVTTRQAWELVRVNTHFENNFYIWTLAKDIFTN